MKPWLRKCVANPAPVMVVLFILAGAFAVISEPVAWVVVAAALVTLGQWLRHLWSRSRVATILLSIGLPVFAIFQTPSYERDFSLLLFFLPGALGLLIEGLVRSTGSTLFEPEPALPEPPDAQKAKPARMHGCLRGLGCLAVFGAFIGVYFVWTLNAPAIAANAFKEEIQAGMKLSDVVIQSFGAGRHLVMVNAAEGATRLYVGSSAVTVGEETGDTESAVRALLERRATELRVDSLTFMFLTTIPVRSSIVVRFGPDGRVVAVEGPFHRAD